MLGAQVIAEQYRVCQIDRTVSPYLRRNVYGNQDSQFGCFQFKAVQISAL